MLSLLVHHRSHWAHHCLWIRRVPPPIQRRAHIAGQRRLEGWAPSRWLVVYQLRQEVSCGGRRALQPELQRWDRTSNTRAGGRGGGGGGGGAFPRPPVLPTAPRSHP
eukprot:SAG31_NODE_3863_length_3810_cov_9.181083_1_plen_106_part_10